MAAQLPQWAELIKAQQLNNGIADQPQLQPLGMAEGGGPGITPETMIPVDEKALRKLLAQKFSANIEQQTSDIDADRARLAAEQNRSGFEKMDLSPLHRMAMQMGADPSGAAGYKPPDNTKETALREAISKKQSGLADDELAYLKTSLEDKAKSRQEGTQNRFLAAQDKNIFQDVKKGYQKPVEDLNTFYQSHDAVKSALATGDVAAIQSSLSNFARLNGEKGVLTDQDIIRVVPDNLKGRAAKWLQFIKSDPTVQAPPEVVQALAQGMERLTDAAEGKFKSSAENNRSMYSEGPMSYGNYGQKLYDQSLKNLRKRGGPLGGADDANAGGLVDQATASKAKALLEKRRAAKQPKGN
jgi:hypothetical protein